MIYEKQALTYEEQANQILGRRMETEKSTLIGVLQQVSYYRLSGYWFPFRKYQSELFKDGTSLKTIHDRYLFDRHLRLLVLDGIERIEIAIRKGITYQLAHFNGAFGYTSANSFPRLDHFQFTTLQEEFRKEYSRSKETFASHFQSKYGEVHDGLPIWMTTELISFGTLFTMFRGISIPLSKAIAKKYGIAEPVLLSWLGSLNTIRNICAHHARLWNRELGYKPMLPNKDDDWKVPVVIQSSKIFVILCILQYMLNFVAPNSQWKNRFLELLKQYPTIPIREMGFPEKWKQVSFWNLENQT